MNHTVHVLLSVLLLAALSTVNVEALTANEDSKAQDPNCLECDTTDQTKCKTCKDKFGFDESKKCGACDGHCTDCKKNGAGKCDPDKCDTGYTFDETTKACKQSGGGDCKAQDPNCQICVFGSAKACFKCNDGFHVSQGKCVKNDKCNIDNCVKCDDTNACTQCEDKFEKEKGGCVVKCGVEFCSECQPGSSNTCKVCQNTYTLKDGKCTGKDGVSYMHVTPAAFAALLASAVALHAL